MKKDFQRLEVINNVTELTEQCNKSNSCVWQFNSMHRYVRYELWIEAIDKGRTLNELYWIARKANHLHGF